MGDLLDIPIWRLTSDEIETLPKREQQWARIALGEMRIDGTLAMLRANPPDTKYQTVYDGKWCLRPIETTPPNLEAKMKEIFDRWKASDKGKTEAEFTATLDERAASPLPPSERNADENTGGAQS